MCASASENPESLNGTEEGETLVLRRIEAARSRPSHQSRKPASAWQSNKCHRWLLTFDSISPSSEQSGTQTTNHWFLTLLFWDDPPSNYPVENEDATWKIDGWFRWKFLHTNSPFFGSTFPMCWRFPALAPWPILPSALLAAPAAPPLLGSWRHAPPPAPRPSPQRRHAALQRRRTKQRGVGLRQQGGLQQQLHPGKLTFWTWKMEVWKMTFLFHLGDLLGSSRYFFRV